MKTSQSAATAHSNGHGNGHGNGVASTSSALRSTREKRGGRMVGDWQLQKTLGAGSMGKVKLATNIHTKEKV